MKAKNVVLAVFLVLGVAGLFAYFNTKETSVGALLPQFGAPKQTFDFSSIPAKKIIKSEYAIHQTFNNCAPAALSMGLYHFGIEASQEKLAAIMRPVNNTSGKNDDKETTPEEIGAVAESFGLISYYRPAGEIKILKALIANDIPIIIRTLLHDDEDFAHYRVIRGYDDINARLIGDDGIEGAGVQIPYARFNRLWKPFNYAYLVIAKPEQKELVESILGEDLDLDTAWGRAADNARTALKRDPDDTLAGFNLSVALEYLNDHKGSVEAYEKVESKLTQHTIWYQIQPIEAYQALGNYDRVFALTNQIINAGNVAYSELYMLRGKSYLAQGDAGKAKMEFEKAVLYNKNLTSAKEALASVQ